MLTMVTWRSSVSLSGAHPKRKWSLRRDRHVVMWPLVQSDHIILCLVKREKWVEDGTFFEKVAIWIFPAGQSFNLANQLMITHRLHCVSHACAWFMREIRVHGGGSPSNPFPRNDLISTHIFASYNLWNALKSYARRNQYWGNAAPNLHVIHICRYHSDCWPQLKSNFKSSSKNWCLSHPGWRVC